MTAEADIERHPCRRCGVPVYGHVLCQACWQDWLLHGESSGSQPFVLTCTRCGVVTTWDDALCDNCGPAVPS